MILVFRFWFLTDAALKCLVTLAALDRAGGFSAYHSLSSLFGASVTSTWMDVFSTSPFLLLKRSNLGLLWVVNWSMHGIGQFIRVTSLLECVRTCLPREVRGFQRAPTWMVAGHLSWFLWTQIMPVLFSDAHTFFFLLWPLQLYSHGLYPRWPHLTGHMPGMTFSC